MTETDHGQPEGFAGTESGADHIMNRPFTLFIVQHSHIDIDRQMIHANDAKSQLL